MQTSGALCREIAKLYPTVIVRWQLNFVARMSEAKSGTTLAPSRMSLRSSGLRARQKLEASAPQRLQSLEGQALGIADAGQIEFTDEGGGGLAVAIGQRHDGIDGNSLGVHVASSCCQGPQATQRIGTPVNPALTVRIW